MKARKSSTPHGAQLHAASRAPWADIISSTAIALLFALAPRPCTAQSQPAPTLDWQQQQCAPFKPAGTRFVWNNDKPATYSVLNAQPQEAQDPEESGVDWWEDVCKLYDEDSVQIGYVTVGYTISVNWGYADSCLSLNTPTGTPDPRLLESWDRRRGQVRQVIARYDLNGDQKWFKFGNVGVFYSVIQDREGNLLAVGEASNHSPLIDISSPQVPMYMNPSEDLLTLVDSTACGSKRQASVVKYDTTGAVLWNNVYSYYDDQDTVYTKLGWARGVVESNYAGTPGYRVAAAGELQWVNHTPTLRPFVFDIGTDGLLKWRHGYTGLVVNGDTIISPTSRLCGANGIARAPFGLGDKFAIIGSRQVTATSRDAAWIVYIDDSIDHEAPVWIKDTYLNRSAIDADSSFNQSTTRVNFGLDGNQPFILWPVMHDFKCRTSLSGGVTNAVTSAGNHEATAKLYKLDLDGGFLWESPADLGQVRAFDLQFDAIQTTDGDIAVSCTKWPDSLNIDHPWRWEYFPAGVQDCLLDTVDGLGYDPDPTGTGTINNSAPLRDPYPWNDPAIANTNRYGYCGTDSYVAKVNGANGQLRWEYQWDEGSGALATSCYPENWRQRQCNFSIVEADDGGLVVCGNTGRNMDDFYLAKLSSCDRRATYASLTLDGNNEYHITSNTTWSTDMNVRGSVVVDAGKTLTIDDANIGFADSRQLGYTTNIRIAPGGNLVVRNGTVLTSIPGCPTSMWDGITITGPTSYASVLSSMPTVTVTSSTIRNAFTALMFNNADPRTPHVNPADGAWGKLTATNVSFLNNKYDIAMSPNHQELPGAGFGLAKNKVIQCTFRTDTVLNYALEKPVAHALLKGMRNINFYGCHFENTTDLDPTDPRQWGNGIQAYNSTFQVVDQDTTRSNFAHLYHGVRASKFTPDHTARVDHARFNGCAGGLSLWGLNDAQVTRNDFDVPDLSMDALGLDGTFGSYFFGCTGFEFQQNTFHVSAAENLHPKAGAVVQDCGPEFNKIYNNTFDGFTSTDTVVSSAGLVVMGDNDGPSPGDGLQIKCNDLSNAVTNEYDVAFTGNLVKISDQQGSDFDNTSPAGNTFALDCGNSAQHFFVEDSLNTINYFHHERKDTIELVPECTSIFVDTINTHFPYTKAQACPSGLNAQFTSAQLRTAVTNAEAEMDTLVEVYDDWRDGGNTSGLLAMISDTHVDSYDLRNELMVLAPSVSDTAWNAVLRRIPAMNPWHLAEALYANRPLERPVETAVQSSWVADYYNTLVDNEDGGGISSHTIMKSEIGDYYGQQVAALSGLTTRALLDTVEATLDTAYAMHYDHPVHSSLHSRIGLALADADYTKARTLVDLGLAGDTLLDFFNVLDMYLQLVNDGLPPDSLDNTSKDALRTITGGGAYGTAQAMAWLEWLGEGASESFTLPLATRKMHWRPEPRHTKLPALLSAFPNPSDGPVFLLARVPEGMERAEVRVVDVQGRLILAKGLDPHTQVVELPEALNAGLYAAALYGDGFALGTAKFEVVH